MSPDYLGEEKLTALEQQAAEQLALSGHCAQATFAVLDDAYGLDGGRTFKALTLMPGVALRGETCGALLGGLSALGLVCGRDEPGDTAAFLAALPAGRQLCRRFEQQHGGSHCTDILEAGLGQPFDLASKAGFSAYLACGGLEHCSRVTQTAVRLTAELIEEWEEAQASDDPGVLLTV